MKSTFILLALFSVFAAHPHDRGVHRRTYYDGGWVMNIAVDRFTQQARCHLFQGAWRSPRSITFARRALGFRFAERIDTADAWYRIDGGPPRRALDNDPTLVHNDTPLDTGDLLNPSGGVVWIPVDQVADAETVAIKPTRHSGAVEYHPRGFRAALEAARVNGCAPDTAFVP